MAEYRVYFRESVEKDFGRIPKKDLRKILSRIEALATDPRPPGHEKLTGAAMGTSYSPPVKRSFMI